ncbi:MAG: hypothetical protein MUC60_15845 [Oscillatoria sp. Prado101]|jgi:hypothetical protein|nr:hypothetical protein [Oscillatoria sp. Prado101]
MSAKREIILLLCNAPGAGADIDRTPLREGKLLWLSVTANGYICQQQGA